MGETVKGHEKQVAYDVMQSSKVKFKNFVIIARILMKSANEERLEAKEEGVHVQEELGDLEKE